MHTVRLIALLLAVAASAANGQQIAADSSYKITLMINGIAVKGSQELGPLIKNEPVAGAVFDANPPMELARGKSYQAKVLVTDSSGQPRDYTRNARLRYDAFCMTASALGVLTATPSAGVPCDGPEYPGLWVALLDRSGNVVALNQYIFHVTQ